MRRYVQKEEEEKVGTHTYKRKKQTWKNEAKTGGQYLQNT